MSSDTTPEPSHSFFHKLGGYFRSFKDREYRDSLLRHLSKADRPVVPVVNRMVKSEEVFRHSSGKVIRNIYYRPLRVFGPSNIDDTTFQSSMKLINFANRLHYNTRQWAVRQALFFQPNDTINAYELADNERYIRNQPYISDARLYIQHDSTNSDSVDILVVTKDEFEYGADVSHLSPSEVTTSVYNNNLFGAAQRLQTGFSWNDDYLPKLRGELQYTKYNVAGSYSDLSVGYTTLNNHTRLDTGVYEGSYYFDVERPLYTTRAKLVGGISLASNYSINIYNRPDSSFRDYRYRVVDVWGGYNFRNRYKNDGSVDAGPNLALLLRHYNRFFDRKPVQDIYKTDPVYNNRNFYLGQFVLFKQDFFKADHFFGFGRTEDIPLGYHATASFGIDKWLGENRSYTAIGLQKYWSTSQKGLLNTTLNISSFWHEGSEDAVLQADLDYYSRLFIFPWGFLRQFFKIHYLNSPNSHFYKPLNINRENGLTGFRHSELNGYQRLNLSSETVYYSHLKFYGFKFNFFTAFQASQLSDHSRNLFKNTIYAGLGAGCRIRNENLPINTLQVAVNYYPVTPAGVKSFFVSLTTVADLRFNIFALKKPGFPDFQ